MSLFGGSVSDEFDDSQVTLTPSWLSTTENASNESTQPAQEREEPLKLDSEDEYGPGIEVEEEEYEEEEEGFEAVQHTRPNRFTGPPQTWRGYTESDRQIAASLDQMQDSDLAVHLYNAHALKRRVLRPARDIAELKTWQPRYTWLRSDDDLHYIDNASGLEQKELIPPKEWTAWPQRPRMLHDRRPEWIDRDPDQWMVAAAKLPDAGEELREEALAMFLRLAKDKWRSRRGRDRTAVSRRKIAASKKPNQLASQTVSGDGDVNNVDSGEEEASVGADGESTGVPTDNDGEGQDRHASKKRGRQPKEFTFTKVAIMADDAKAQTLLLPTINSMLSQLDDLASIIRRTRKNHVGLLSDERSSSRPRSRPKEKSTMSQNSSTRPASRALSAGRKLVAEQEDAENDLSASDHAVSSRKLQKRKRLSTTETKSRKRSRVPPGRKENSMDWSEVLGLAAMGGWDQGAVARTAQRCATLFGESMSFVPFDEGAALNPLPEPVQYTPSTIPAPDSVPITKPLDLKRPFFQIGTTRCPHTDCDSYEKDFVYQKRVVEHCKRVHGYDPRTNDSDNEERKFGGVHVDGFLQPITAKPGWLGPGRERARVVTTKRKGQSKSKKTREEDKEEDINVSDGSEGIDSQ